MLPIKQWFDPSSEKDAEYANWIIRWVRQQGQPLVNIEKALLGMDYLFGQQNMSATEYLFQNPASLNLQNKSLSPITQRGYITDPHGQAVSSHPQNHLQDEMSMIDFKSLPIFEKIRNILIAEMKKMGPIVTCRANDPTSDTPRKNDETLIKRGKHISAFLSYLYTSTGQPPVDMDSYAERFGSKPDSGNTKDFAAMGLNPEDKDDVDFFMKNFHKLSWEIDMQSVIDAVLSFNEVQDEMFEKWVNDILAKKAIAAQVYISDVNGAVKFNYLTPETVFIYGGGRRKDYNDANAKYYQQLVTVKEFLDHVGNSFDWDLQLDSLIQAVFTASNGAVDITGIRPDWRGYGNNEWFAKGRNNTTYSYNQFMQFRVLLGYMEWIATDQTDYGAKIAARSSKVDKSDKKSRKKKVGASVQDNQNPDGERYQSEARYDTPTYKAYYLAVTAYDHIMYDFGKVTYQQIKGYNDTLSNFTIVTYKEVGDPIAIIGIPFIDLINECWYKSKYEIRKAKPRGTNYNYDSLITIARNLYADTAMTDSEKFEKIINWRDKSANGVWTFPIVDGRPVIMSTNQLDIDMANGVTPEIMRYWEIMANARNLLIDITMGSADLRQGESTGDRSSMNNEFKALEYSQNSTYYLPDMLTFMCRQLSIRTGLYVQDIITFKNHDTLAYNFLLDMIGPDALDNIEVMGKTSMHRYGIFVESLNQSAARAKLSARIDFGIQNGMITNAQALLLEDIKSPKLAFRTLAYFEERTTKQKQAQAMQQQQAQQQGAMQLKQMDLALEQKKLDTVLLKQKMASDSDIEKGLNTQKGGLAKQAMKHSSDVDLIYHEANADFQTQETNLNNFGKTTPPMPSAPNANPGMPPQGQGPNPPPQRPLSGIQEQMQQTAPAPTTGQ